MSKTQQSKSRRKTPADPSPAPAAFEALTKVAQAQASLHRVERLCHDAQAHRRSTVAEAWRKGATAKQISIALGVSLAKTYTLLPQGRKA